MKSHLNINQNNAKQHSSVIPNQPPGKFSVQKSSPSLSYGLYYDSKNISTNNDLSNTDNHSSFFILNRDAFNRRSVPHSEYKTEYDRHRLSLPIKLVPYPLSEFIISASPLNERQSVNDGKKHVTLNTVAFVSPSVAPVHDASLVSKKFVKKA